jgi:hypothetical protein
MARDHYVPQFYLRNFQITTKPGWVYSYQRKRRPKPIAIRTATQEEDYYDLKRDDPTVDKDGVDKLLWLSENNSSKAINELLTGSLNNLNGADIGFLSWFIGLLAARTPFAREALRSHQEAFMNRDLKRMLRDEEEFQKFLAAHQDKDPEELKAARKAFLDGVMSVEFGRGGETEDFLMAGQLQFADMIVDILQRKFWTLVETNNERPFITSDNPVIVMPTIYHTPQMSLGYADGDILVPLSPKRALIFKQGPWGGGKVLSLYERKMAECQFYTITQCQTSVFSHVENGEFQTILDSTEEGKIHEVHLPPDTQS